MSVYRTIGPLGVQLHDILLFLYKSPKIFILIKNGRKFKACLGERTGLVVRASDSGSGDPSSILGRVGVLFP